ncbi:hypothetical protein COU76_01000 [Candidatus Peregrinibacteria bacterium CG10_big_fil_rev_8_21_14_0_10_49_10]|nr:MAG: hypothetical protein COU76_01000 [Candidatus Peregrinibacteria bacterium CG10_big_fil_rev_8_21_14_0_10_49_10]
MEPLDRSDTQGISRFPLLLFATGLAVAAWIVLPLPSLSFDLPKVLVLSFVTLVVFTSLLFGSPPALLSRLLSHSAGKWLLFFLLTVLLSLLWSVAPMLSFFGASPRFEGVLTYILYLCIALIGLLAGTSGEGRRVLVQAILITNIGIVLYGLLQVLHLDVLSFLWAGEVFLGRTFSFVGQPNTLGLFLVLTIPFVLLSADFASTRWRRAGLLLFLCNVVVLLATVSRSALLGIGIAFLFVPCWMHGRFQPMSRKKWFVSILCAVLLAAFGLYKTHMRFSVPTETGRSLGARALIWQSSVQMISQRPLGYGLETFGILSARHMTNDLLKVESLTTRIDRAHSKPLDLLLTLGPLGLLAYYGLLCTLLRSLWKKRKESGMHRYYLAGFLSILAASIALLFGFDVPVTAAFFWLIVGMMLGCILPQDVAPKSEKPFLFLLSLFLVVLLVVMGQWVQARLRMERAEQWFTSGNLVQSVNAYAEAVDAFRFDRHILTQSIETDLFALENAADTQAVQTVHSLIASQLTELEQLTGGEDGMAFLLRAWEKAIVGEAESVHILLDQAAAKSPAGVVHYRIALHCYDLLGDSDAKARIYKELIAVLPEAWLQPESPHGRLIWKENPWLEAVREYLDVKEEQ